MRKLALLAMIIVSAVYSQACDPCGSCKSKSPVTPTATPSAVPTPTPSTIPTPTPTPTGIITPTATPTCAVGVPPTTGSLLVADSGNQRVLEFLPPFTIGMRASVVFGQPNFTSSGQNVTQSGMGNPEATAFDEFGNLWAGDFYFGRVIDFVPPFSNGMNASLVIGQTNFTATGAATTASGFNLPQFFTFDPAGNLWVADYSNNRVLEFAAPLSTGESASRVIGQSNFTSGAGGTSQNTLSAPFGVEFDPDGDLWVADSANLRALEFVPPFTNGMNASVVIGQANFTSANSATTQNGLASASDVKFDSAGNLYVADPNNNRVLIYNPNVGGPKFTNGMNASVVIGQQNFTTATAATSAGGMRGPLGVTIGP